MNNTNEKTAMVEKKDIVLNASNMMLNYCLATGERLPMAKLG